MMIEILIDEPFQSPALAKLLEKAIAATLAAENAQGDVTLVVGDDEAITELNQRFLGNPGPTDVLSFPAQPTADAFVPAPVAEPYLGDIVIAYPYAAAQAARYGRAVAAELALLAVHGTLHLLGYDHAEPEEKATMWARQDAILESMQTP
jgi:probable rRNA maturation factor